MRPQSKEEEAINDISNEQETKSMNQLQAAARNQKISEAERKGMLTIAQQFERYKKAYETVKFEKEQLMDEQDRIQITFEKVEKQKEDFKL